MLKDGNLSGFGTGVPMLDGASGIENEWIVIVGLLGKWFPLDREETGFGIIGWKIPVGVETGRCDFGGSRGKWPLDSALAFNQRVIKAGVIAHATGGNTSPFFKGVFRYMPGGKEFVAAAELLRDG